MKNIAIFASGEGTNAERIIQYFKNSNTIRVAIIIYNRINAGIAKRAINHQITAKYLNKEGFQDSAQLLPLLKENHVDFIVLDGFLLLLPKYILESYPGNIVNIHPSLIPLHSGKGFFGIKVHEDVIACGDKETGITIHLIDENYDRGNIVLQVKCPVLNNDTPEDVAQRVHRLEYENYAPTIEALVLNKTVAELNNL